MMLAVKNLLANTGDVRDTGSIPGWVRSPGGEHGHPLQYSCLENPTERGTWQDTVHRVAKSQTLLKQLGMDACARTHTHTHTRIHDIFFILKMVVEHLE